MSSCTGNWFNARCSTRMRRHCRCCMSRGTSRKARAICGCTEQAEMPSILSCCMSTSRTGKENHLDPNRYLCYVLKMEDIQDLFKETIAEFMENGLEAELDDELGYSKYDYKNKDTDNSRNGHSSKTLRTSMGEVEISVPRDRKGEFEPKVLKKNQTSISQDIEEKIVHVCQRDDHRRHRGSYSGYLRRRGI